MAYTFASMNPIYQPAMRLVSNITNANPASVTTTFAHQYITGTIVRIDMVSGYGMPQINQQFGPITVTGATTFTLPIDTTLMDPFTLQTMLPYAAQSPQSVPTGELSSQLTAATLNILNPYN